MTFRTRVTAALLAGTCVLAGCASQVAGTGSAGGSGPAASSGASAPSSAAASSSAAPSSAPAPSSAAGSSAAGSSTDSGPAASSAPVASSAAPESMTASEQPQSSAPQSSAPQNDEKQQIAVFAARMETSVLDVTSMRGSMDLTAGPIREKGTFASTLANGKTTAMDMKMTVAGSGQSIDLHMRTVGKKAYLGPAATLAQMGVDTGGKPWVLLSASSSNQVLSQMAGQMDQATSQAGVQQYATMVKAATDLKKIGPATVGGVAATHYLITVNVAKMAEAGVTDSSAAQAAQQAGLKNIPLHVWLDAKGRPIQVQEKFAVQGQQIDVLVKMGQYNKPLTIPAPAAKNVATG